ncbi:MAG: alpha/beta hydrolase [Pseudomonadota bacterium]
MPPRRSSYFMASCLLGLLGACSSVPRTGIASLANGSIAYSLTGMQTPSSVPVVLQAGLGDGMAVWTSLIPELERSSPVFAYDRPGYGDSDSVTGPRDPCSIASEERRLLLAAGLQPPYILVGHSLGGLYQYAYAKLYPEEVAALLLLDPTHPDHWHRMQQDALAAAALLKAARATLFSAVEKREFDEQAACLSRLDMTTPLRVPTRLLVHANASLLEQAAFNSVQHRLQLDWLRLTSARQLDTVPGSGHHMQTDDPAAVLRAIAELAKGPPHHTP